MTDLQSQLIHAIELHQQGDFSAADPIYRSILTAVPHHLEAMYLLGTLELQQGRFTEAIELLSEFCRVKPDVASAHNNLGIACQASGRIDEAVSCFERVIARDKDYGQAYFNLGRIRQSQQRLPEAAASYRRAHELDPQDEQTLRHLAEVHVEQQAWRQAEDCCRELLTLTPSDDEMRIRLGYVLTQQEKLSEATQIYEELGRQQPDYAEMQQNLAYVYERQGRLADAERAARRAVELRPDSAEAFNNLGIALRSLHRLPEACAAFDQALTLQPDFPLARFNLGTTRLMAGELQQGWPGFEARELLTTLASPARPEPRWQGEPLTGKTLLVFADEGLGDTLQFARFLPQAKAASGANIVLECQTSLCGLLKNVAGADEVVAGRHSTQTCDAAVSLLSLPGILGTSLDSLPAEIPYVRTDSSSTEPFADILAANAINVGLVWHGNPAQPRNPLRSCPLAEFRPLLDIPGVNFVSLQVGSEGTAQIAEADLHGRLTDTSGRLNDFQDTAQLINGLDLVVTVDTSVAHLAGAMGCEVWTLLSHTPDWRWMLQRSDSSWYPTMRLFRQPVWGDWPSVIAQVAQGLTALAAVKSR